MRGLLIWAGALTLVIGVKIIMDMPRGVRNNNPGNIRKSRDAWQGLAPVQSDPDFFIFEGPEWGIRAMARILQNYRDRYNLVTVRDIISRWAPSNENDTESYIRGVSRRLGVSPDQPLNFTYDLQPLVKAIIHHENGKIPYNDETINFGVSMA